MFRAAERTVRLVAAHSCTEIEPEYPAHLVVEHVLTRPAVAQSLKIGIRKMVGIITIGSSHSKAVGPCAELKIKSIGDCLVSVVASAPV